MSRTVRSPELRKKAPDGKPFTPTEQRRKEQLMRQFLQVDGPKGVTEAYKEGWDRIFGGKQ